MLEHPQGVADHVFNTELHLPQWSGVGVVEEIVDQVVEAIDLSGDDVHQDHSQVSKATRAATKYVPRVLMYQSNIYPSTKMFRGNIYHDISDFFQLKLDAIKMYRSELDRVNNKWIDNVRLQNALDGQKIGVEYAESFEPIKYLAP